MLWKLKSLDLVALVVLLALCLPASPLSQSSEPIALTASSSSVAPRALAKGHDWLHATTPISRTFYRLFEPLHALVTLPHQG